MSLSLLNSALRQELFTPGWRDDLPEDLERNFDRRALLPRFLVLGILAAGALLEYGHGHRLGHWIVLVVYGTTTLVLAVWSRYRTGGSWLAWAATAADALLTLYVISDHLPDNVDEALDATDALSLLPAFLLLLQTGLRLRRDLVLLFAGMVTLGWAALLVSSIGADGWLDFNEESLAARQALGLLSFASAAAFVFYAVHRMRIASASILRARLDQLMLSRFMPAGLAEAVVRGDEATEVTKRHVCLLSIDLRGFSVLSRHRPSSEVVRILMSFRRAAQEAVTSQRGLIDKYLGDGVLAVFLEGAPEDQAKSALRAAERMLKTWNEWNNTHSPTGPVRIIACLHPGHVLAGVFDDGTRAEFTVLGPAMNALSRIERRAKEVDADLVVSKRFLRLVASSAPQHQAERLHRTGADLELPDLFVLGFRHDLS